MSRGKLHRKFHLNVPHEKKKPQSPKQLRRRKISEIQPHTCNFTGGLRYEIYRVRGKKIVHFPPPDKQPAKRRDAARADGWVAIAPVFEDEKPEVLFRDEERARREEQREREEFEKGEQVIQKLKAEWHGFVATGTTKHPALKCLSPR